MVVLRPGSSAFVHFRVVRVIRGSKKALTTNHTNHTKKTLTNIIKGCHDTITYRVLGRGRISWPDYESSRHPARLSGI